MSGPHDLFVRFTFGHPERAAAELRAVLPPHVVSQVDWESLRREPGSVVDPELRETESDLLFSARLSGGRPLLFYVLLEHQSSVDRWMALRMLRYVVRQLEHWRKEHPGSVLLPIIVPLVMFHGPGGGWSAPRRVEELFDVPGEGEQPELWRALVPRFEYLVDDGFEELGVVVHYLMLVGDASGQGAAVDMLHSMVGAQRAEELMYSWSAKFVEEALQKGRREGEAKGLAEGLAKARAEDVLRILAARGVRVDEEARQRIFSCTDMATLDRWFDRSLTATRLADVLGDLAQ